MCKHIKKTQFNECLICLSPILSNISWSHIVRDIPLCSSCVQKFEIIDQVIDFYHYPLRILYSYNEFFRKLLFQYKGLYDLALKDAFLYLFLDQLHKHYKTYLIVTAPSWKEDDIQRGFAPIQTIAYTLSSRVFTGLYKKEKYKQSDLSYEERQKVNEKIGIKNGEELRGQKVLILDDVLTSGSTLLACLSHVLKYEPKSVELLVLSTKKNIKDLRFVKDEG